MTDLRVTADAVADDMRSEIAAGKLRPGDRLPLVADLAQHYGVSDNTISKAVKKLKAEGVLTGVAGGPTRVRVQPPHRIRDNRHYQEEKDRVLLSEDERRNFGQAELVMGIPVRKLYSDEYKYEIVECPENIAEILQIAPLSRVLKRTYKRQHVENAGSGRSTSYIPYDIVKDHPALTDANSEPWPGGTMHQLYTAGYEVGLTEDRITAKMPTGEEQKEYDIPPGVPIFHLEKITYSTDGLPLEIAFIPIPADRVEFRYFTPLTKWEK